MTLVPQCSSLGFPSHLGPAVRIPDSKDGGRAALSLLLNGLLNLVHLLSLRLNKETKSTPRNSSRERNVVRLLLTPFRKELGSTTR